MACKDCPDPESCTADKVCIHYYEIQRQREPDAVRTKYPKVVGNALITSDGRTFQLRLLDVLYFRIGIVSAERLVQVYDDQTPTKGC